MSRILLLQVFFLAFAPAAFAADRLAELKSSFLLVETPDLASSSDFKLQLVIDDYRSMLDDLPMLSAQNGAKRVRQTGLKLGASLTEVEGVVPRYLELQAEAQRGGGKIDALKLSKLDPQARAEFEKSNAELYEIEKLAKSGDVEEAGRRFAKVVENLGSNSGLLEKGFGSIPMQTTLAWVQKAGDAIPEKYRGGAGSLDTQLQRIAAERISVPAPTKEEAPKLEKASLTELSFYSALSHMPLVSHWAKEKVYTASTGRMLADNPDVESFQKNDADPSGKAVPGFTVKYKDGSTRYENAAGASLSKSKDGSTVIEEDPQKGSYKKTINGKEIVSWTTDPKTGTRHGVFRGTAFEAGHKEMIIASPDGTKLFVASGADKEGKPVIARWYGYEQKGQVFPGLGQSYVSWGRRGNRTELKFDSSVLQRVMAGEEIDYSSIPPNLLAPGAMKSYAAYVRDLPQFGELYAQALGGKSEQQWVESLGVVDGRFEMKIGDKQTEEGLRVVAELETQGLKVFEIMGDTVFIKQFNPEYTACVMSSRDHYAKEGVVFKPMRYYDKKGGAWKLTKNIPVELKAWTTGDTLSVVGSATLDSIGTGVGVVFSPFQSALYNVEGGIWLTGGAIGSTVDSEHIASAMAKVEGVYTIYGAKWTEWVAKDQRNQDNLLRGGKPLTEEEHQLDYAELKYAAAEAALNEKTRKDWNGLLDMEIAESRKKYYGELWKFHKDDPITRQDRVLMADRMHGLSNMPGQFFKAGREAYERGDKWGGRFNYAAGGFVVGGSAFVEGAGFGAAANGLKLAAVSARTGLAVEEVALSVRMAKQAKNGLVAFTDGQKAAVGMYRSLTFTELGVMLGPGLIQMGVDGTRYFTAKDDESKWRSGDALFSHVAGFSGLAVGLGKSLVESRVQSWKAARSPLGKSAEVITGAPDSYRQRVFLAELPKAELDKVLSTEGSSALVLEGTVNGQKVAVKSFKGPTEYAIKTQGKDKAWKQNIEYFDAEIMKAQEMSRILGPEGMAPKVLGEVDIGGKGNPSFATEVIAGKSLDGMTAAEAKVLIKPETIRQAAEGIRKLKEAGWGGGDSPQIMILTKDQVINGVQRKAGDVVFMDAGGLSKDPAHWRQTPQSMASDVAMAWLKGNEKLTNAQAKTPLGDLVLDPVLRQELQMRADALAKKYSEPQPVKTVENVPGKTDHGTGAVSGEELSINKQGRLLIYNKKTKSFSVTTSRATSASDGSTVTFLVGKDGKVEIRGGDDSGINRSEVQQSAREFARKMDEGKSAPKKEEKVWDLEEPSPEPKKRGNVTGKDARVRNYDQADNKDALRRQNDAAKVLAEQGYDVKQNGEKAGADFELSGNGLTGKGFDCYSPTTASVRSIWSTLEDKMNGKKQADSFVLNMEGTKVTDAALIKQFRDFPIEGLNTILLVRDGRVLTFMEGGKIDYGFTVGKE